MVIITKFKEFFPREICAIVRDDGIRHPKVVDDVLEESCSLRRLRCRDRLCFDPFCEFVHGDKQVGEAPGRFAQGSNHVQSPDRNGPRDGNVLERLSRHVGLPSVELAPFVGAHDLIGVGDRRRLVETLTECLSD